MSVYVGIADLAERLDFVAVDDQGQVRVEQHAPLPAAEMVTRLRAFLPAAPSAIGYVTDAGALAVHAQLAAPPSIAFVTTEGFADVLEWGNVTPTDRHALMPHKPPALLPASHRLEVRERMSAHGEVLTPLSPAALDGLVERLRALDVRQVAVTLLHAHKFPQHEAALLAHLRAHGFVASGSHELSREEGEYARSVLTIFDVWARAAVEERVAALQSITENVQVVGADGMAKTGQSAVATLRGRNAALALAGSLAAIPLGGNALCVSTDAPARYEILLIADGKPTTRTSGTFPAAREYGPAQHVYPYAQTVCDVRGMMGNAADDALTAARISRVAQKLAASIGRSPSELTLLLASPEGSRLSAAMRAEWHLSEIHHTSPDTPLAALGALAAIFAVADLPDATDAGTPAKAIRNALRKMFFP